MLKLVINTHTEPVRMFKVVAADDKGRLVSVYDGKTTYVLGKSTQAARGANAFPPLDAMIYCHETLRGALALKFPRFSKMRDAPMIGIEVEASGRAYVKPATGPNGAMWAVERVKTLRYASEMMISVKL